VPGENYSQSHDTTEKAKTQEKTELRRKFVMSEEEKMVYILRKLVNADEYVIDQVYEFLLEADGEE
jgi:hypothetical protein